MKITWLGHSSFLLKDSKDRTVLMDPFDESVGYTIYKGNADIVTISHHHFDHDFTEAVQGYPHIIDKVGNFYESDIPITGFPSYHDNVKGDKRGLNTIYIVEMDNLRICHLGDLGYILTKEEAAALGVIDILFIPVGGNYTIDGGDAAKLAKVINSHIVIPMHYKTEAINFPISGAEDFLQKMQNVQRLNQPGIEINAPLKGLNEVKLLDYKK
jgi:L-ascorbate metabolism protein UlaG (beta-lactamase superfamily)